MQENFTLEMAKEEFWKHTVGENAHVDEELVHNSAELGSRLVLARNLFPPLAFQCLFRLYHTYIPGPQFCSYMTKVNIFSFSLAQGKCRNFVPLAWIFILTSASLLLHRTEHKVLYANISPWCSFFPPLVGTCRTADATEVFCRS